MMCSGCGAIWEDHTVQKNTLRRRSLRPVPAFHFSRTLVRLFDRNAPAAALLARAYARPPQGRAPQREGCMRKLYLLTAVIAAAGALAACESSSPSASRTGGGTTTMSTAPGTMGTSPGTMGSGSTMSRSVTDPAAVDATRQNSQTIGGGDTRMGTNVPSTGGGAGGSEGGGGAGSAGAGAGGGSSR
jgi:hypothetical protein